MRITMMLSFLVAEVYCAALSAMSMVYIALSLTAASG